MRRDVGKGAAPVVSAEQLAASADLSSQVRPIQLSNVGGPELTASILTRLHDHLHALDDRHQGAVIALGTDAIEEVGFFLALTLRPRVPIVLTGAMRTHDDEEPDGPGNLVYSTALVQGGLAPGVYVSFAGRLFEGARVTKTHTSDPDAFSLDPTHAAIPPHLPFRGFAHPVYIVKPGLMDDLAFLDHVNDLSGLVVEASGEGNLPSACEDRIAAYARRLPVLLTSRTASGDLGSSYSYPGGSRRLQEAGVITSRWTSPKLRVLTSLAVAAYGQDARKVLKESLTHP